MSDARERLGTQIWLRPDDSPERVRRLFDAASDVGLGWARLFLVWPWIEPDPDEWDFAVYDAAFDAAAAADVRIKATLTANSGPWHVGTPSMLQSHTGFLSEDQYPKMERYVRACAERYGDHEALGQWVLWNEPNGRVGCAGGRSDASLAHWRRWLAEEYDDVDDLNREWRTGYDAFEEVPFPEDVPHETHRGSHWNSWQPWIADWRARADWLVEQLEWVKSTLRDVDPDTAVCTNPAAAMDNRAQVGYDLNAIADLVDVLGATHHPPWQHAFADRSDTPGLVAAGVSLQSTLPGADRYEVTEVQTGDAYTSGLRPADVTPEEIARFHLTALAAGAESVTGWCFNVRSQGNEAGDWALLDDDDRPSRRSRALSRFHDRLDRILDETGEWARPEPRAWVVSDADAHAQEWLWNRLGTGGDRPGRATEDGAHGALLLAAELMGLGVPTAVARLADVPTDPEPGDLAVASHQVAWDAATAERLLAFADAGGTVVLDGTSGRFDPTTRLNRPWPGGLAGPLGVRGTGLSADEHGHGLTLHGADAETVPLVRSRQEWADAWESWSSLRFAADQSPVVRERPYGDGRVVYARAVLGPTVLHEAEPVGVRHLLERVAPPRDEYLCPVGTGRTTLALPVETETGPLTAVVRTDAFDDPGRIAITTTDAAGSVRDLYADVERESTDGEVAFHADDGAALLRTE